MNKLILISLTATAMASATAPVLARDNVEYAKVVSSNPIYREVRISSPRQECYDERVVYREPAYRSSNNGAATLLGAVLGGVAGHQFGKGRGNAVATAAGAVIGAGVGQSQSRGYSGGGYNERVSYEPRCTTYNEYRSEQRVEGYDVAYRYQGRVYHTRMSHDPGSHIPVNVDVTPVSDYPNY